MNDLFPNDSSMPSQETAEEYARIAQLIDLGRQKGWVTIDDILALYPDAEQDVQNLDKAFAALLHAGIAFDDRIDPDEDSLQEPEEEPIHAHDGTDPLAGIEADDLIGLYLKEAASIPLLTGEEEIELAQRIERGRIARKKLMASQIGAKDSRKLTSEIEDEQLALEHLVTANSRLVVSVAKKYVGQGLPLSDLIQEGNIGLMRAAKKFDYRRGYKFSTYATWWIRQAVGRAVATQGRTIRLPVHMKDKINKILRTQHQLKQQLERDPTIEELASALDLPIAKVEEMLHTARHPLSLEMPINAEGDTILGDFVEDDQTPNPEDTATANMLREQLLAALEAVLPPREARILKMRYGLLDGEAHTLREVGCRAGVTRERVRQIEAQALKRLREPEIRQKLIGYLR